MLINPTEWFQNEEIRLKDVRSLEQADFVEQLRTVVQASPLLVFDWPGDQGSSLSGYRRAHEVARASGAELARTLELVIREVQPERLWLHANSMGGQVGISLDNKDATSLDMDANFENTWHYAIGARYRIDPVWSVSAGFAYDQSPVSNSNRSVAMPLDRQRRYAVGLQYQLRKDLTFGAASEYMDADDVPVNQSGGILRGDYTGEMDSADFHFFALNMNWKS